MEKSKGEKLEYASPLERPILRNLSVAPATNDGCTEDDKARLYNMLKDLMINLELQYNDEEASPGPLDWKKIHGEDYQEPDASWHKKEKNDNNDDLYDKEWDDLCEDDSVWSGSSLILEQSYSKLSDAKFLNHLEPRQTDRDMRNAVAPHINEKSIEQPPQQVLRRNALLATLHGNNPLAEPAPQGKVLGRKRVRHHNKIKDNFIRCLMGSGTFGWSLVSWEGWSNQEEVQVRCGFTCTINSALKGDCCIDSDESDVQAVPSQQRHSYKTTNKKKSLQEVRCFLAASCSEETDWKAACALSKWR